MRGQDRALELGHPALRDGDPSLHSKILCNLPQVTVILRNLTGLEVEGRFHVFRHESTEISKVFKRPPVGRAMS